MRLSLFHRLTWFELVGSSWEHTAHKRLQKITLFAADVDSSEEWYNTMSSNVDDASTLRFSSLPMQAYVRNSETTPRRPSSVQESRKACMEIISKPEFLSMFLASRSEPQSIFVLAQRHSRCRESGSLHFPNSRSSAPKST